MGIFPLFCSFFVQSGVLGLTVSLCECLKCFISIYLSINF